MIRFALEKFRPEISGALGPYMTREVWAAGLLTAAVLAGKLSFAPPAPSPGLPAHLFEFRLWLTVVAVLLSVRRMSEVRQYLSPVQACTGLLLAYLVLRSLGLAGSGDQILDAFFMAVQITGLAVLAVRARCLTAIGCVALGAATGLFVLALFGVNDEVLNGNGWAPIGGPITFYRIEFLGLCISLYCFLGRPRIVYLALIGIFFFATWASLSKIAIFASLIALTPVFYVYLGRREFGKVSLVAVAILIGCLVWQERYGTIMQLRISEAANVSQISPNERPSSNGLHAGQDLALSAEYCTRSADRTSVCRSNVLVDRSGRLILFAQAMHGFLESPLFGMGLGQYRLTSINKSTGIEQAYLYPHNIVAEMMYSGGVIALSLLLLILGYSLMAYRRAVRLEPRACTIIGLGIFILLSALASGDLYDLRLFLCASVVLCVLCRELPNARR